MQQIISHNLKLGREQPLVIALDEFPTLSLKIVLNWLNEERFNGASIIVGVQYLGQIIARYGKDWSDGFLASCATKIWFNPGEDNTAQYLSKSLGEQELAISNRSNTVNYGKNSGDSRSTNDQLHKKPLIEAHAIRQLPQGACIIESPGVGDKQVAGVPFQHHFSYSDREATAFRSKSAREFAQIRALMVESQQDSLDTDYSQKLAEYNQILDKLLPLPESKQDPDSKPQQQIVGSKLLNLFEPAGVDLSGFEIEPTCQYHLLPDMIDGQNFKISLQDLPRLLAHNYPHKDYSHKLDYYHLVLKKILLPQPTQPEPSSTESPQALGRDLAAYFGGLGHDISGYQIELTKQYLVPPELVDGRNFTIDIHDLPKLIAYNQ